MKKFKSFLKDNMIIFDFISKIIIGTASIIVVIIANQISSNQLKLEKEQTAPAFFINKTEDIKEVNNDIYKIENKGGKIEYFDFNRYDRFFIDVKDIDIEVFIDYTNNKDIENNNKANTWYFSPKEKFVDTESLRERLLNYLKEKYPNKYVNVAMPQNFYVLTYHDYKNTYHEDYYSDYGYKVVFNKTLTELTMYSTNDNFVSSMHISAVFENEDILYENIIDNLSKILDRYIN